MKILIWDIEMSYALALVYPSHKPQYIPPSSYIKDQFMPCAAWSWYGEDKIHLASVLDDKEAFKKDYTNDKAVVKKLYDAVSEADILVGHNSKGFDIKHLNWLAIQHGMPPLEEKLHIDTLTACRAIFKAPSNKLDELTKRLIGDNKMDTSKGMHKKVALGVRSAIKEMGKYNIQDVAIQKAFYTKIRPWIRNHPSVDRNETRDSNGDIVNLCPRCASPNIVRNGKRPMGGMSKRFRQNWKCKSCTGFFVGAIIK